MTGHTPLFLLCVFDNCHTNVEGELKMLNHLNISGLAVIEKLSISFSSEFNVITGETGAGKSILIRGLSILLGSKSGGNLVRKGFENAIVSGLFNVSRSHPTFKKLSDAGVPVESEGDSCSVMLRRQISAKGRSQCWINDFPVSQGFLKEAGSLLIDIFGQNQNLKLLSPPEHQGLLDNFVKDMPNRVRSLAITIHKKMDEIVSMAAQFEQKIRGLDYIKFRVDELNGFEPSEDDYSLTEDRCRSYDAMIKKRDRINQALSLVDGGDNYLPLSSSIAKLAGLLGELGLDDSMSYEVSAMIQPLEEVSYSLNKEVGNFAHLEEKAERDRERLSGYHSLFRKMAAADIHDLMDAWRKLQRDLDSLENAEAHLANIFDNIQSSIREYRKAAKSLSAARVKVASDFKHKIKTELLELNMEAAEIDVEFSEVKRKRQEDPPSFLSEDLKSRWIKVNGELSQVSELGFERIQFMLAANKGEPLLPLSKVASGGELSRIMLALKKVLADDADTCVLVFDEIDSGISGKAADVVGKKMRVLAKDFQIICISHLAQVAAYSETHFLVKKSVKKSRTESEILKLSYDESAHEIARLLSGTEIATPSLKNAHYLMKKAVSSIGHSTDAQLL